MPEPEPTAILVVLRPGTTDVEAATLRTALRMWSHVVDVRPVSKNNTQMIAEARVRSEVVGNLTPIFENLKDEIGHVLDAATDSFQVVTGDEPSATMIPLQEHRNTNGAGA